MRICWGPRPKSQVQEAKTTYRQALDELETKEEFSPRNADVVACRKIERLRVLVDARRAEVNAKQAKLSTPAAAQKANGEAPLAQAQVDVFRVKGTSNNAVLCGVIFGLRGSAAISRRSGSV
jgi:hypothetical protein